MKERVTVMHIENFTKLLFQENTTFFSFWINLLLYKCFQCFIFYGIIQLKILINFKTQNMQIFLFFIKYVIHFIGRWIIRYSILVHICLLISQEKSINKMKERVTVMHLENFTKLLFQVILWTFKFLKEDFFTDYTLSYCIFTKHLTQYICHI